MAAHPRPKQTATRDGDQALALFDKVFPGESWQAWRAWLCAVFGIAPRTEQARQLIRDCTGRASLPSRLAREVWNIIGRRGGKGRMAALLAVFVAVFRKYVLAPGERGLVLVLASDRRQAQVVFQYIVAIFESVPALANLITRRTAERLDLSNGISIEVATASYRTVRGYTVVAAILDEIAFWSADAGNPDTEVVNAIRPAMSTVDNSLLIALSTPFARRGELHRMFEKYYGQDSDQTGVLIWRAPSLVMNPTLSANTVQRAYDDDETAAASEYGAEFRRDLERLFAADAVRAVVVPGRRELPYIAGTRYTGFVDPSGGSADSFTLAIAHKGTEGQAVLDLTREIRPPFSPAAVVEEYAAVLRAYHIVTVTADRYGGEFPRELLRKHGIAYTPSDLTRSELYLRLLPMINSASVELLEDPRLAGQLVGLDRRTGKSGKDAVDHRAGAFDDLSNAAAGALVLAVAASGGLALWPEDFTQCLKAANIRGFDLARCALLGGPVHPDGTSCYSYCAGWRECRPAWRAHQEGGGTLTLREFARQQFAGNDFTSRIALDHFVRNVWMV